MNAIQNLQHQLTTRKFATIVGLAGIAAIHLMDLPGKFTETPYLAWAYMGMIGAAFGLGFMFVVAAEFMGASEGLGYLLVDGQQVGRSDLIVSAILSFAVLGFLTDALLAAVGGPSVVNDWMRRQGYTAELEGVAKK